MLERLQTDFEQASRRYAEMYGILQDDDWFILELFEEVGELTQAWNRVSGRARPKGLDEMALRTAMEDEAADLLGHVLLFAHRHRLDLDAAIAAAIARKWHFSPAGAEDAAAPSSEPAGRPEIVENREDGLPAVEIVGVGNGQPLR